MTPPRAASRATCRLLCVTLGRDRANAILGDVSEELARRAADGRGPRWPRLWSEARALGYLLAEARASAPLSLRAFSHIVRDSLRALGAAPGTTAFIVLILTLGISAATVTFSVVDTVVLQRLPFPKSDGLVVLQLAGLRTGQSQGLIFSAQEYVAWREAPGVLSGLAAYTTYSRELAAESGGQTVAVPAAQVTASLFQVLDVPPIAGRWFNAHDETSGQQTTVVIGEGLARRLFGGVEQALGRSLRLSGSSQSPCTVVGVMPAWFTYPLDVPARVEVWQPLDVTPFMSGHGGLTRYFHLLGRVESGVSIDRVRAGLDAAIAPLGQQFPGASTEWPPRVIPLYEFLVGNVRGWMLLVLAAVGLVMLVACANVANLLLARSTIRTREMSIRASLGASRRLLVTSLLVESLLLSLAAAALGVLVAMWGVGAAKAALPEGIARASSIGLDPRVLGAAISAALITGLVFGAVPAWQTSRADLVTLLKDGGSTTAGGRRRWRTAFVVCEVAFVGTLLVATTLVVASFVNITRLDLGFDRDRLLATGSVRVTGTLDDALAALGHLRGVASVGAMGMGAPPLVMRIGVGGSASTRIRRADSDRSVGVQMRRVSDGYFATARMPFRRGSGFEHAAGPSVVLDELAARTLFPDRDPIGAAVRLGNDSLTVVGVVEHVHLNGPEADADAQMYLPLVERNGSLAPLPLLNGGSLQFLIRTSIPTEQVIPAVQATTTRLARPRPGWPAPRVVAVEDAFREITADRRFNAGLMGIFGALALTIGIAGIYGVMSSVVAQQTREIGVRVALGASAARIRRHVVGQAGRYLTAGLIIGLPAAWFVTRAFGSLYFGVTPANVLVYLLVAALMVAAGLAAAVVPARRASRVDPIEVLRA